MDPSFPSSEKSPPGKGWYLVAAIVAFSGLIAFSVFLFLRLSHLGEGYLRVVVPGEAEISLNKPGEYVIHHEFKSVVDGKIYSMTAGQGLEGVKIEVFELPDAKPVALRQSTMSSTYSFGSYEGRSLMEFTIASPGRFRIKASRDDGALSPRAVLSIAQESVSDILITVFAGIGIFFGSFATGTAIFIWTFLKRRRVFLGSGALRI